MGVASPSVEAEASAVTVSGAVPDEGATVRAAAGAASGGGEPDGWNSYAPRSSYGSGPTPVFGVAGSSTRALPSTSRPGWPLTPEFPESIAGDPAMRWKSPPAWFTHLGEPWTA